MFSLLANLFVRSALILGLGGLLCRVLRRLRPAQRHAILLSAFGLLLLWPVLAASVPEISLPLWKSALARASVTIQQTALASRVAPSSQRFTISPLFVWFGVAAFALIPLLVAQFRLRSLLACAVSCEDCDWNILLYELSQQFGLSQVPELFVHPESIMPMASGIWCPRIILPCDSTDWPPARRRIVLLHELAHIARRDLITQSCARVIAALWWFQPLAWSGLRLLRRESEKACDELVIAAGVRPSDYAAELLAIAQSFIANRRSVGIAMACQDGLQGRVRSILQPHSARTPRSAFIAILCLAALALAASAVTLSPESQPLSQRGHTMKHTLFAGLLASAGLSAATIGGSLADPSGAAVPNAKALLIDPDTNAKFETTSSADGKFVFETLPAGNYILRVQSPGFATLFREFSVKADTKVDQLTFSLNKTRDELTISGDVISLTDRAAGGESKRVPVGGTVAEANLIKKVQPMYPPAAKEAGVQGTVELDTVISKEGEPLDIRVVRSPSEDLSQSALEAVRQWRYHPTLLNGNPVEIETTIVVNYTLSK